MSHCRNNLIFKLLKIEVTFLQVIRPIICLKIDDYMQIVIITEVTIGFNLIRVDTIHYFLNILYADCDYNPGDYNLILLNNYSTYPPLVNNVITIPVR